ncbi:MAG: glycosyltransferase, partial [Bacillota bacterium]
FFSTRKLLKFMKEYKPDVVHIHELHAYFINFLPVIKYLKDNNIKTIWTFHCEYMYTGNCGHAFDCNNWLHECGNCPSIRSYPKSLFFDFTKKMFLDKKRAFEGFHNLTIVTPSKWLAGRVQQSFLKNKRIRIIYNGIDTKVFQPRAVDDLRKKHNLTTERILLAVAPNLLSDEKGGKYVLETASRMTDDNMKFILIGVDEVGAEYDENVIVLGKILDQVELSKYYSLADSFLICSKKETFPTVCLESLACGTPVYGFDAGGVKETAPDGLGVFVPYGDVEGLVEVIKRNDFSEDISSQCEQYAKEHYSKEAMYQKYKELYF